MTALFVIAWKEVRDGLRNRWVVATTLLLAALALTLAFLGAAPTGTVKVSPLAVTVVSLSSLTIFLVPLIALLLSYDAIVGEIDRGTMALLLAYPAARWEVIVGKFLGHLLILAFATSVGYGAAGAALTLAGGGEADPDAWNAFLALIGSSALLGAVFLAIGYFISTLVRERATAGGIAIGIWLLLVLIYDMALLGLLVADQGRNVTAAALGWLLLLNPVDAYRLFNLGGQANVSVFAGMAGLSEQIRLGHAAVFAALGAWVVVPLVAAAALFARKPV
jgi:Cu-processing system permease protein